LYYARRRTALSTRLGRFSRIRKAVRNPRVLDPFSKLADAVEKVRQRVVRRAIAVLFWPEIFQMGRLLCLRAQLLHRRRKFV
jgi:hypothetical protein